MQAGYNYSDSLALVLPTALSGSFGKEAGQRQPFFFIPCLRTQAADGGRRLTHDLTAALYPVPPLFLDS